MTGIDGQCIIKFHIVEPKGAVTIIVAVVGVADVFVKDADPLGPDTGEYP